MGRRSKEDALPVAHHLTNLEADDGEYLYNKWKLECYDVEDFAVWLLAYKKSPGINQNGKEIPPVRRLFCGEANRAECKIQRELGKCILTIKQFQTANTYAESEQLREDWEFMDVVP